MKGCVRTENFTMPYLMFGEGERPMVILPGMSLTPVSDTAPAIEAAFRRFTDHHTVYLFDRRRELPEDYTVAAMAEDTAAVMKALGIRQADLFGASQGGQIAQSLAARYPALVGKMVLASTACCPNPVSHGTFIAWEQITQLKTAEARNQLIFEKVYSPEYREKLREAFAALAKEGGWQEFHRWEILARASRIYDSSEEIGKIRCQCLVLGSRQDLVFGSQASEELAERLHAPCYVYEGYSHAVYDEAPDFLERVYAFFEKNV